MDNNTARVVPLTKILATLFFSFMAIVLNNPLYLLILLLVEIALVGIAGQLQKQFKTLVGFTIFAIILGLIQYAVVEDINSSLEIALRMYCMGVIFLILLVTTKLQDLTTALVEQCKISYEYAFMFTAALRFIPDFIDESKSVREAQMCRGMDVEGSLLSRLKSYSSVVQPLVLRSLARSETMALSLELRGFGSSKHKFSNKVNMKGLDYFLTLLMFIAAVGCFYVRINHL